ncbi:MAG: 16S rRNA (cytosine(1402)-N(4))-methyltransferase RsmH [Pseudomonadota bacterium]
MTRGGGKRVSATTGQERHVPVLLPQVLDALNPQSNETYIDATFGAGGYSKAILEAAPCSLLSVDRDCDSIVEGQHLVDSFSPRLMLFQGRFSKIEEIAKAAGLEAVDGIVFDLGVSSMQLDRSERGFSFMREGPLDMRMGKDGETAAEVLARLSEKELADIFFKLGEERRSRAIAKAIVVQRETAPLVSTFDLANLVERVLGRRPDEAKHPATRVFQALRLFINRELDELVDGLQAAERLLKVGGRLVVVTFHSLEDRIVKRFLTEKSGNKANPSRHIPMDNLSKKSGENRSCFQLVNRRAVKPNDREIKNNPRARSAHLRWGVRTQAPAYKLDHQSLGLPEIGKS